jgi:hypothetical protein
VVEILKSPSGATPVPDDQVENVLLEGPLTGLRGVNDRLDHKKLHIHVDEIPGSVMIDVEPHQVQL